MSQKTAIQVYQQVMAKAYTDADFRKELFENPLAFAQKKHLSKDWVLEFAEELGEKVEFFAHSLIRKRMGILKFFLPASLLHFKDFIPIDFQEFAEQVTLASKDRYAKDAIRFLDFLIQKRKSSLKDWEIELLTFEKKLIQEYRSYFKMQRLQYNIPQIRQYILSNKHFEIKRQRKLLLHFRLGTKIYVRFL